MASEKVFSMLLPLYFLASLNLFDLVNGLTEVQLGGTTISGLSLPTFGQEFFGGNLNCCHVDIVLS